ncbi:MAG: transporter [Caulobacteraceae bacterium]
MSGWDVSAKAGVTLNGTNPSTDYYTGTEFHIEGSLEKMFGPSWSAGLQTYYFSQLTNDGGPGDTVGAFRGEVTGFGGSVAYHFDIAKKPATLRMKV